MTNQAGQLLEEVWWVQHITLQVAKIVSSGDRFVNQLHLYRLDDLEHSLIFIVIYWL